VEEALLLGQHPIGCTGLRSRIRSGDGTEEDWRDLLLVTARIGPPAGCLDLTGADQLAEWAAGRPGWRGARAEWLAVRGRVAEADGLLAAPGEDAARLRVALLRGDGDGARVAAEGALVESPRDILACRILGRDALEQGDATWALELSDCGGLGARSPELVRLAGEALELAGEFAAAEEVYVRVNADVHRAALLYQVNPTPERREEAARLLSEPGGAAAPPVRLHRAWMALQAGGEPDLAGLDESIPALVIRALARGTPEDVAALARATSAPTAVARARVAAERRDRSAAIQALADALAAAPASEPVHRARLALLLDLGEDPGRALEEWAALDPDHVAAVGERGSRDLPWAVLVPERWDALAARHPDPRMRADAPAGKDAIGERIRAARRLPTASARADALAALGREVAGLDGLAAERYRVGPSPPGAPARAP
jgi:hypothetical protein